MSQRFSLLDPDEAARGITAAVAAIRAGDLVVMPTDTVYGLAADPFSNPAVDRLLRAKDRGRETPPPVLVGSVAALQGLADDVDDRVDRLVEEFWPGGLSLVLRVQPSVNWDLGETRETVMLRMPDHDQALQLLRRTGPLAVTSANRHGRPPATTVEHAEAELGDRVEVYLDGGPTPGDVPSTILDLTRITPQLLRRGVVTDEMLRELIPSMEVDIDGEPMPGEELLAEWEAEQARLDAEEAEAEAERERKRAAGEFLEEDEEIPFEPWPEGEGPDSRAAEVEADEPTGPVEYVELAERTEHGERTGAGEAVPVDHGENAQESEAETGSVELPGAGGERADRVDEVLPQGEQPAGGESEPESTVAQAEEQERTDAVADPDPVEPPEVADAADSPEIPETAETPETPKAPTAPARPDLAGATATDDRPEEPVTDPDDGQTDPVRDRSRQQD